MEFADAPSVDSITHDKRVQSEFLDYMKIAHERVEWSIFDHFMISQRVALQWHRELLSLEAGLSLSSRFGELRRMVSTAAGVFGLKDTRDRVRRAREVRLAFYLQRQHSQGARFGWWLSVLIGVLGVPVLGREVVLPLMQIMRILPEHAGPEHQLVSIAVAAVVWLALAGAAWRTLAPQVDSE